MDLWLDTDPGFDDWMAWLLVESMPQWRLHGVSVVAGNAPLPVTLANALRIKRLHGFETPVHAGCDRPLAQPAVTAQAVLGAEGMESLGRQLPAEQAACAEGHGVQAFIDAVRAHPGRITLLALGPLTNIATAFQIAPDLPERLDRIVLMGGSTTGGNATAAAEFNIHADPEAAARVFDCGRTIEMFGLNVCRQMPVGQPHVDWVRAIGSEQALLFADYLDGYIEVARRRGRPVQSLYDPAPVIYLAEPSLFTLQPARVDIELAGRHTRGMTVCDLREKALAQANARVAMSARTEAVLEWAMVQLERRLG